MRENNELIARFMGVKLHDGMSVFDPTFNEPPEELQYNSSWDWLMPVVEKIEEIALNVVIETGCVTIDVMDDAFPEYHSTITYEWQEDTKLNVLYRAVIEFITWYNTTKQPQPERESDRSNEPSSEL